MATGARVTMNVMVHTWRGQVFNSSGVARGQQRTTEVHIWHLELRSSFTQWNYAQGTHPSCAATPANVSTLHSA